MDVTFSNLTCGYLDQNFLFVPLTDLEIAQGKADLAKNVTFVVRGDVFRGPYDSQKDGIEDTNSDGRADNLLDATVNQYLIPDSSLLLLDVHYYVRQAQELSGGGTTILSSPTGAPVAQPEESVGTTTPGNPLVENGIPAYWYMFIKPIGGSNNLLFPGSILEVAVNPRLPYTVKSTTNNTSLNR